MARLITKFKYLKPDARKSVGGYARYIATREGVEKIDQSFKLSPSSQKQQRLIEKIIRNFPDCKEMLEYEDYLKEPTLGNASEFITRALEDNAYEVMQTKTYADYIATRPRAERFGSHGLFTDDGVPVKLNTVSDELNRHGGNVWTVIISLRREDAERLGFNTGERWRDMLRTQTAAIAKSFKMPMEDLKWYGAFHNESHHPHVHLMIYTSEDHKPYLSRQGIMSLRSSLAKDIFQQDLLCIYEQQTQHRDNLRQQSRDLIAQIVSQINAGTYDNPRLEEMLTELADRLSKTGGKKQYGYQVSVIDLRNPTRSNGNNLLHLVNKYMDLYKEHPDTLVYKAKWFAGAALNTSDQSMASVMSTPLSRLNSFLDSELEQLLCFDTEIDAEKFCNEKSAIFIIMPEENPNTFFMISLIIQQLYREILAVADERGGKLKNRCVFFCDEFGTMPKIESAEMMFSASRSRRLQIVPIIQSFSQQDKNYGKEGAEIIVDNTQLTIFGGFAPNSSSAEVLPKALGSRTVMSGSVSRSKNDPSQSLQMMERPLLTPDELKSLPKGEFVVMKTGVHPIRVKLKLFFKWGIEFDEKHPYTVPDNGGRTVEYVERKEIVDGIMKKYPPRRSGKEETRSTDTAPGGQEQSQRPEPKKTPAAKPSEKKSGGAAMRPVPPSRRTPLNKQGGMPHEPS